eukprot:gene3531-10118_t
MEEQRVARTEAATSALIAEVQKLTGRSRVASQRATALQLTVMSEKAETTSDALAKAVLLAESASLSSHLGNRAAAVDGAVRVGQLIPTFGDEAEADLLPNGCRSDRWACTLAACVLAENDEWGDAMTILFTTMSAHKIPLLSSRGYIGAARLVPVLDNIHSKLGARAKKSSGRKRKAEREAKAAAASAAAAARKTSSSGVAAAGPAVLCQTCSAAFPSRNAMFRHLKRLDILCGKPEGYSIVAAKATAALAAEKAAAAAAARSVKPKVGKSKRVERKAPLISGAAVSLWFGDIPQAFASNKRISEVLYNNMPRGMPMPATPAAITTAVGDKSQAQAQDLSDCRGQAPWLGYAFVLFRDAAEAVQATAAFNGLDVGGGWVIRIMPGIERKGSTPRRKAAGLAASADPSLGHQLFPTSLRPN